MRLHFHKYISNSAWSVWLLSAHWIDAKVQFVYFFSRSFFPSLYLGLHRVDLERCATILFVERFNKTDYKLVISDFYSILLKIMCYTMLNYSKQKHKTPTCPECAHECDGQIFPPAPRSLMINYTNYRRDYCVYVCGGCGGHHPCLKPPFTLICSFVLRRFSILSEQNIHKSRNNAIFLCIISRKQNDKCVQCSCSIASESNWINIRYKIVTEQ